MNILVAQNEDKKIIIPLANKAGTPIVEVPTAASFIVYDDADLPIITYNLCGGIVHGGNELAVSVNGDDTDDVTPAKYRYEFWVDLPTTGRAMTSGSFAVSKSTTRIVVCV